MLAEATQRLREEPDDPLALVRAVTVYHLIVEGTVALAGQRHILEHLRTTETFPGLREGFTHVTRDESRHVGFGVLLLRDAIAADPAAAGVIAETVLQSIPAAVATLEPPGGDERYYTAFGYTRESVAVPGSSGSSSVTKISSGSPGSTASTPIGSERAVVLANGVASSARASQILAVGRVTSRPWPSTTRKVSRTVPGPKSALPGTIATSSPGARQSSSSVGASGSSCAEEEPPQPAARERTARPATAATRTRRV